MKPNRSYEPFHGDGRLLVDPIDPPEATKAIPVTNGTARNIVDSFVEIGESNHSSKGSVSWVVIAWCKAQNVKYDFQIVKFKRRIIGYKIVRVNE